MKNKFDDNRKEFDGSNLKSGGMCFGAIKKSVLGKIENEKIPVFDPLNDFTPNKVVLGRPGRGRRFIFDPEGVLGRAGEGKALHLGENGEWVQHTP